MHLQKTPEETYSLLSQNASYLPFRYLDLFSMRNYLDRCYSFNTTQISNAIIKHQGNMSYEYISDFTEDFFLIYI